MKIHRNKLILLALALQILMLLSVIALVYGISARGQAVVLEMTGYDPYDALRGRYLRLDNQVRDVPLESGSIERYQHMSTGNIPVYVVLGNDPDSGLSRFSYASLDRPDRHIPYIRCMSRRLWTDGEETRVSIHPRINQYYLNEHLAEQLDHSVRWDSKVLLTLKIWHGMYVVDGIEIDGETY